MIIYFSKTIIDTYLQVLPENLKKRNNFLGPFIWF